jgi:hypothetical protein
MFTLTLAEYNAKPASSRGIWTVERLDLTDWRRLRDKFLGKRTMLANEPGHGTVLLVEGQNFRIQG